MKEVLLGVLLLVGVPLLLLFLWVGFDGPRRDRIRGHHGFGVLPAPEGAPKWDWNNFSGETEWYRENKRQQQ